MADLDALTDAGVWQSGQDAHPDAPSSKRTIGSAAVLIMAALLLTPGTGQAAERFPSHTALRIEVAAVETRGTAAPHPCGFAVDRGPSGLAASRLGAIEVTIARLSEWISARRCTSLVVASFADAGAYTSRTSFEVPTPPRRLDCDSVTVGEVDTKHAPLVIFGGYGQRLEMKAREKCVQAVARADSAFALAWTAFLRNVRSSVAQDQVPVPLASAISPLLDSFFAVGVSDVLMITTGIDGAGIPDRLPPTSHVVIVGFEAKEGFLGRSATDAASEKWRRAGAHVVTAQQITPGVLSRLAKGL